MTTCHGTALHCAYTQFDNVEVPPFQRDNATAAEEAGIAVGDRGNKCMAPCNDTIYHSRITFASFPNKALFAKMSKTSEICKVIKKILKICNEWLDPNSDGAFGLFGDEQKGNCFQEIKSTRLSLNLLCHFGVRDDINIGEGKEKNIELSLNKSSLKRPSEIQLRLQIKQVSKA